MSTRLVKKFSQLIFVIKKKLSYVENFFSIKLFLLFLGFLGGSLFGSFLPNLPAKMSIQSITILVIILTIELLNYVMYKSQKRFFFISPFISKLNQLWSVLKILINSFLFLNFKPFQNKNNLNTLNLLIKEKTDSKNPKIENYEVITSQPTWQNFIKSINSFKIGIMLGLFIDAFKVGS